MVLIPTEEVHQAQAVAEVTAVAAAEAAVPTHRVAREVVHTLVEAAAAVAEEAVAVHQVAEVHLQVVDNFQSELKG